MRGRVQLTSQARYKYSDAAHCGPSVLCGAQTQSNHCARLELNALLSRPRARVRTPRISEQMQVPRLMITVSLRGGIFARQPCFSRIDACVKTPNAEQKPALRFPPPKKPTKTLQGHSSASEQGEPGTQCDGRGSALHVSPSRLLFQPVPPLPSRSSLSPHVHD